MIKLIYYKIDTVPKHVLEVKFGTHSINMGTIMTPTQVKSPPKVHWNADSNKFYTLCMTGITIIYQSIYMVN